MEQATATDSSPSAGSIRPTGRAGEDAVRSTPSPPAVLITGIGCIGKSTLRRRAADVLGDAVVCVDRDDGTPDPSLAPGQILVVESVHGLDEPAERWGLVVYLLPPPGHLGRWLRRGLAWWRAGRVDRPPRVERRPWSVRNLPLIARLAARNVRNARRWVREDLRRVEGMAQGRVVVTVDANEALLAVVGFVGGHAEGRAT